MTSDRGRSATIGILAVTQIVSWGSIYYAFAILSPQMQRDLGLGPGVVYGGFSWSLLVAGMCATPTGILLDRFGGRAIMGSGSLCAALGLALLGGSHSLTAYLVAWTIIGLSMGMTLYEAAFATINREYAATARRSISILTLFGGLASTVFWPLTMKLGTVMGWRDTYFAYACVHLLLCAPLHTMLPSPRGYAPEVQKSKRDHTLAEALRHPVFWWLALAFAANSFVFSALSVHLIPLLQRMGHTMGTVVGFAALIGPMQVAGRIGEMVFARNVSPRFVGAVTFTIVPFALVIVAWMGIHAWAAIGFCLLYGLSNGIITIVRGTLPQALFGAKNYGAISGAMAGPSLIFKAAGPLAVAAIMTVVPSPSVVLIILLALSLVSLGCYLIAIRPKHEPQRDTGSGEGEFLPELQLPGTNIDPFAGRPEWFQPPR